MWAQIWFLVIRALDSGPTDDGGRHLQLQPSGEWDLVGKKDRPVDRLLSKVRTFLSGLFFCQRSMGKWTKNNTNAARRRILTSRSRWWCGGGPSTTGLTCSSHVSWSPLWLCWSLFCQLSLGRRSHWVRNKHTLTHTHTHNYVPCGAHDSILLLLGLSLKLYIITVTPAISVGIE